MNSNQYLYTALTLSLVIFFLSFFIGGVATIALGTTVGAGLALKGVERRAIEGAEQKKALEPPPFNMNQPLACAEWGQRRVERGLVEAGAMEEADMTVCENDECEDCITTRRAYRVREAEQKAIAELESQRRLDEEVAKKKALARERAAKEAAAERARMEAQHKAAVEKRKADMAERKKAEKKILDRMREGVFEPYDVLSNQTGLISRHVDVFDPDTNEYLGTCIVTPGGETRVKLAGEGKQNTPPKDDPALATAMMWARELDHLSVNELKKLGINEGQIMQYLKYCNQESENTRPVARQSGDKGANIDMSYMRKANKYAKMISDHNQKMNEMSRALNYFYQENQ